MSVCCRSLLLGLLIIVCLQSCTVGQSANVPKACCFSFYTRPIPISAIKEYEETRPDCTRAGVIFTVKKNNARVCVDPGFRWVKRAMDKIDAQKLF